MNQNKDLGASPQAGKPALVSDQAPSGLAPTGFDPAREDSYEAKVFSAHLPNRTIAFIYQDGGPRLACGIYRITFARIATEEDERKFPSPPENICPLCNQPEPFE